ncbi:Uncharacterised protein [Vibrio cholerae]|nr:Uncharacterised protein [Vibrio cholerae]
MMPSIGARNWVKERRSFANSSSARAIWRCAAISSNCDLANKPFSTSGCERRYWLSITENRA